MSMLNKAKAMLARFKGTEWLVLLVLLGVLGSLALGSLTGDGGLLASGGGTASGADAMEARLSEVLSRIAGAGRVEVMVYYGVETVTASTWLTTDTTKATRTPVGVVVVADGAGEVRVQLELLRAVQTLMGLPADAVEIFQMERAE